MTSDPHYPTAATRHGRPAAPITASQRREAAKPSRNSWNILAIVGLTLGVAALVVAFVPDVGIVALPLAAIGLILAVIGLVQVKRGAGDRGLAIAGTVVSGVALL